MNTALVVIDYLFPNGKLLTHFFRQKDSFKWLQITRLDDIEPTQSQPSDLDIGAIRIHHYASCSYNQLIVLKKIRDDVVPIDHIRVYTGSNVECEVLYNLILPVGYRIKTLKPKNLDKSDRVSYKLDPKHDIVLLQIIQSCMGEFSIEFDMEFVINGEDKTNYNAYKKVELFTDLSLKHVRKEHVIPQPEQANLQSFPQNTNMPIPVSIQSQVAGQNQIREIELFDAGKKCWEKENKPKYSSKNKRREICRGFLKKYHIKDRPNYTALQLADYISKMKNKF